MFRSVPYNYHASKLSIASTHACISPSKASRAYSSGSSIANALSEFCEQRVFPNHPLPYYSQSAICNSQMWLHQYCSSAGYNLHVSISSYQSFLENVLKAFHPVPTAIFIICYKLLPDFLSLIFSLMRVHKRG